MFRDTENNNRLPDCEILIFPFYSQFLGNHLDMTAENYSCEFSAIL